MAALELEEATKVYAGSITAVERLSLTISDGELLALIGPSGCGKTTTLRMIAGLEQVSSGEIRLGGRRVNERPPKDRNIAMVFQSGGLYPHLSVYENMAFGLRMRQGSSWWQRAASRLFWRAHWRELIARQAEIDGRVRQAAGWLELSELLTRRPSELSGGQRQRAALGRAVVRRPAAFLLDEPLSHFDAPLRAATRRELKQLHCRLQATMVYVTHDRAEALTLGDRVAVMDHGRLQQVGEPTAVYDWPANRFVAQFLGDLPINLLAGELEKREGGVVFVSAGGVMPVDNRAVERLQQYSGQSVQLGIRPEDVRLSRVDDGDRRGTVCLEAAATSVETLGDASILQLELRCGGRGGEASVLCKAPSSLRVAAGDRVTIGVDMRRAHFFDPATGENVSRPVRAEGN